MVALEAVVDPNVLVLSFLALFYLAAKALALYDGHVGSTDARSEDAPDDPRPR